MSIKRFELEQVAPEIRKAWEREHKCNLDQLQRKYFVGWKIVFILLFLCITPALITLTSLIITPFGFFKTMENKELLLVTLFVSSVIAVIIVATTAIIADNAEENLRDFNQDILELKSKLSYGVTDETLAIKGAKEALINMATSIMLAELEDDTLRASTTKKEMVELYEFLADFNLTIVPKDKKGPRLLPYFDVARSRAELIVVEMVRKIGRHLTEPQ